MMFLATEVIVHALGTSGWMKHTEFIQYIWANANEVDIIGTSIIYLLKLEEEISGNVPKCHLELHLCLKPKKATRSTLVGNGEWANISTPKSPNPLFSQSHLSKIERKILSTPYPHPNPCFQEASNRSGIDSWLEKYLQIIVKDEWSS